MRKNTIWYYLAHIRDAIETIAEYIEGVAWEQFSTNKMMIDAVVRELEIIGEASNNLTEEFRRNMLICPGGE